MKKQPVYLLCKTKEGMFVKEDRGYIIDLTNNFGYTVKIALMYKAGWHATHYDSGLDCTPHTKTSGEYCFNWKKDDLIERLKAIDFERFIKTNPAIKEYISLIENHKTLTSIME